MLVLRWNKALLLDLLKLCLVLIRMGGKNPHEVTFPFKAIPFTVPDPQNFLESLDGFFDFCFLYIISMNNFVIHKFLQGKLEIEQIH